MYVQKDNTTVCNCGRTNTTISRISPTSWRISLVACPETVCSAGILQEIDPIAVVNLALYCFYCTAVCSAIWQQPIWYSRSHSNNRLSLCSRDTLCNYRMYNTVHIPYSQGLIATVFLYYGYECLVQGYIRLDATVRVKASKTRLPTAYLHKVPISPLRVVWHTKRGSE